MVGWGATIASTSHTKQTKGLTATPPLCGASNTQTELAHKHHYMTPFFWLTMSSTTPSRSMRLAKFILKLHVQHYIFVVGAIPSASGRSKHLRIQCFTIGILSGLPQEQTLDTWQFISLPAESCPEPQDPPPERERRRRENRQSTKMRFPLWERPETTAKENDRQKRARPPPAPGTFLSINGFGFDQRRNRALGEPELIFSEKQFSDHA